MVAFSFELFEIDICEFQRNQNKIYTVDVLKVYQLAKYLFKIRYI
jgi:hypothetical protein